jgi:hypothetical protein
LDGIEAREVIEPIEESIPPLCDDANNRSAVEPLTPARASTRAPGPCSPRISARIVSK